MKIQVPLGHFVSMSTIALGVAATTMVFVTKILVSVTAHFPSLAQIVHENQTVLKTITVRRHTALAAHVTLEQERAGVDGHGSFQARNVSQIAG